MPGLKGSGVSHLPLLLAVALCIAWQPVSAMTHRVVWFTTLHPENADETSGFWARAQLFGRAAAEDLHIELDIRYGEENHILMREQVRQVLGERKRPDAIMFHNYKDIARQLIPAANDARIPVFLFNSGIGLSDQEALGGPRQKYPYWIGQLLPDDVAAGRQLMQHLAETARKQGAGSEVIALLGTPSSTSSAARAEGLKRYMESQPGWSLGQSLHANWSRSEAAQMTPSLLQRYPQTRVYWAANDNMAMGILDAADARRNQLVTGGIDWLDSALLAVQEGRMSVSLGGHFTEPALVMALLSEYLKGRDFSQRHGARLASRMVAYTADEAREWGDLRERLKPARVRAFDFSRLPDLIRQMPGDTLDPRFLIERL